MIAGVNLKTYRSASKEVVIGLITTQSGSQCVCVAAQEGDNAAKEGC